MRYLFLVLSILCCNLSMLGDNYSRTIHTMSEGSDYPYEDLKAWKVPGVVIKGGDAINDGFSIKADFTTPEAPCSKTILTIGAMVGTQFFKALSITQDSSNITLCRQVMLGSEVKEHRVEAWTKGLLKNATNYTLLLEMDETRCRYSIWETGDESGKKYEYEFYGLSNSCVKDILSQPGCVFSVAASIAVYKVQNLVITTLGHGIGVKLPEPKTDVVLGRMSNFNSHKYMTLFNGILSDHNFMVQHSLHQGGSCIWEMIPLYQASRTPLSYKVQLLNLSSNMYLSVNNCLIYNKTPVINVINSDCLTWTMNREMSKSGYFKLWDTATTTYAVVQDASVADNAPVVTWESAYTANSFWDFERVAFHSSIDTGYYLIINKNSNYEVSPALASYESQTVVQYPQFDLGNKVWYIQKDAFGLYTIQNVDSKKYLVVKNASLADNEEIIQWSSAGGGNSKWIIQKQPHTDYYTFQNVHSDKYMSVYMASKGSGVSLVQMGSGGDEKLWKLEKYDFSTPRQVSGLFKLKNIYTNLYLGVQEKSQLIEARLVSRKTVNDASGWWTLIKMEDGGYAIKNVGSQLYANVAGASIDENAIVIQYHMDKGTYKGNSLWTLIPDNLGVQNIYWIRNVHSGKFLFFDSIEYQDEIQAIQVSSDHNMMHRWFLEPAVME